MKKHLDGGKNMQNIFKQTARTSLYVLCLTIIVSLAYAQEAPQLNAVNVTENITLIEGASNTTILTGKDGVFMIDTQTQELIEQMIKKIAEISNQPIRFIVNTHYHFDHSGGNEKAANTGALMIAHENVRKRMSTEQRMDMFNTTTPPSPIAALPVMTFSKDVTFYINGEEAHVFHIGAGHTDGDAIVHFRKANVIHLGDLYFNGLYPYIGIEAGGSINSMIRAGNTILEMINDATRIIPGHGHIASKAEYAEYLGMLTGVRDAIRKQIDAGKPLKEVIASKPLQAFDAKWGKGMFSSDRFAELVYTDLSRK
jgi:cyclase